MKMKQIITVLILFVSSFSFAQQAENTYIMSKVTATWCPNCGTWGWGFMEGGKDEFKDRDYAMVLGVHYSGNLKTDVGVWWANNLSSVGQPTFYMNNNRVSVSSGSWQNKVSEVITGVDQEYALWDGINAFRITNAFINGDGNIETNISINPDMPVGENDYFALYVFENNVQDVQSGLSGTVSHPNVLREGFNENHQGELVSSLGSGDLNFQHAFNENWNRENVGLLAIWWNETADGFVINQAKAIENIGLLSSSEDTLDESLFSVISNESTIELSVTNDDTYNYTISEMSGKILNQGNFRKQKSISSLDLISGMYIVSIQKDNKQFTQKIFVR